jgi:hypothetical protein
MRHILFRSTSKKNIWALTFAIFFFVLLASRSEAQTQEVSALIRQDKKLLQANVTLTDLTSSTSFQGKYFTVVDGETDTPISFDAEASQKLRAATVYYAFSQSRDYFKKVLSSLVETLPEEQRDYLDKPMVIRLNMTHAYSAAVHFNKTGNIYNGAVTVPASDGMRADNVKPWNSETWFFTGKKIKVQNPASGVPGALNNSSFKLSIFESLATQDVTAAIQQVALDNFSSEVFAQDLIVSFALSELLLPATAMAIKMVPSYIYLDAAMIPEIAANEYSHYALYPWLDLKRRFHVGEGYAHYFAAKIVGLTRLQDKSGKYSKGYTPIRGDSPNMYTFANEVGAYAAMSSFTFSVLEDVERSLGSDGLATIVGTLPYLNSDSSLKLDFTRSLYSSLSDLERQGDKKINDKFFVIQTVLEKRGF